MSDDTFHPAEMPDAESTFQTIVAQWWLAELAGLALLVAVIVIAVKVFRASRDR